MLMKVLVIGSHGKVGKRIVKLLVEKGFKVRAMIRDRKQFDEMNALGAEVVIADLEKNFAHAYQDIDLVIFTAGSGSHTGPDKTIAVDQEGAIKSIEMAVRSGIKRYIMVSAQGARNPEQATRIQHYFRAKKIADDYLIQSGLIYTIFRPGRLLDEEGTGQIWLGREPSEKGSTSRDNLARVIVESITLTNTEKKILEVFDGDQDILEALNSI